MASGVVTVFGSSRIRESDEAYAQARELGRCLAEAGHVVASGGHKGIMEAVSRGAKDGGGKTIGIISHEFGKNANPWIDEVQIKNTWKERLFALIETGDAYVLFDGGTGTWAEFFVTWEMMSKKLIPSKPLVVYGNFLKAMMENFRGREGFLFHDALVFAAGAEDVTKALAGAPDREGSF